MSKNGSLKSWQLYVQRTNPPGTRGSKSFVTNPGKPKHVLQHMLTRFPLQGNNRECPCLLKVSLVCLYRTEGMVPDWLSLPCRHPHPHGPWLTEPALQAPTFQEQISQEQLVCTTKKTISGPKFCPVRKKEEITHFGVLLSLVDCFETASCYRAPVSLELTL